jgi:hypothetical protein
MGVFYGHAGLQFKQFGTGPPALGAAFIADAELLIFGEKNVRTEVIGCMLAAIEKPQNVLNGNDVR